MSPRSVRLTLLLAIGFLLAAVMAPTRVFAQSSQISFTSVSHNYGSVASGSSAAYGLRMTNNGSSAFPFALTLSGPSSFTYQDNCGTSLAAGASCEIVFTFAPTGSATVTATWSLSSNITSCVYTPTNGGTLTGSGPSAPGLSITTDGHNFGTQGVQVPSGTYGVVLSNTTSDAITLTINTTPANAADFPMVANTCGASIAANTTCALQWQFDPQAAQGYSAFYAISGVDSVTSQPIVLTSGGQQVSGIQLEGVGINANGVSLTSPSYRFAEQGIGTISPTFTAFLINGTANTIALTYSGANANYVSTANTCGASLAPWQSCGFQWDFQPQTTGYEELDYNITATTNGNPTVITYAGQSVAGITLAGTGILGTVSLRTDGHNFGPWVIGTTSYKYLTILTNSTEETVKLTYGYANPTNGAQYAMPADTCGATLASGASCYLEWDFSPTTTGPIGTTYDIHAMDACGCQPISITTGKVSVPGVLLAGNGQATAGLFLASASHAFGEQGIGGNSATYGTVLYNTTTSAINLAAGYSSATAGENFKIVANDCNATIAANTSCNVEWKFSPVTTGAISVIFDITATQGGTPITLTSGGNPVAGVTLSGTGVE